MINRICLITPSHISSNPRLIKEAITLIDNGFKVNIIFSQTLPYLKIEDDKLIRDNPKITFNIINNKSIINKITHKLCILNYSLLNKINLHNFISNKSYYSFLRTAITFKADLYVAHNLGALSVAVNAAKINITKCGFDAEDFHRNELSNDPNDRDVKLKSFVEDKYLNRLDYFTAASPLIAKAYKNLYPDLNPIVLNNVFEVKHQPKLNLNNSSDLKLFWFSQTIGKNRGLEDVISALNLINNPLIELHLLGNLSNENNQYFSNLAKFKINYYNPISSHQIFSLASKFDVGLALEQNKPLNRDICLTNKIFTYLISGLAIIASDTKAQQQFINENNNVGKLYPMANISKLTELINDFFDNKTLLNEYKNNAYHLAKSKYNWENESKKFIDVINKTLEI